MYIPIGNDLSIRDRDIVGIFDLDKCSYEKKTREFLAKAEQNGEVIPAADDLPKSFILTEQYGFHRVWLVQFNPATLEKRGVK